MSNLKPDTLPDTLTPEQQEALQKQAGTLQQGEMQKQVRRADFELGKGQHLRVPSLPNTRKRG